MYVCNEYYIKLAQLLLLLLLAIYPIYSYIWKHTFTNIYVMYGIREHYPHLLMPSGSLFTSIIIIMIVFACSFLINLIDLFMGCQ